MNDFNSFIRTVAITVVSAFIIALMLMFWRLWPIWLLLLIVPTGIFYFNAYRKTHNPEGTGSFFTEVMIWLHSSSFKSFVRKMILYGLGIILFVVVLTIGISMFASSIYKEEETEKKCLSAVEYLNKYKSHSASFPADLEKMTGNSPVRREWIQDGWGNPLSYTITENGNNFLLQSKGKDGNLNTEDDLKFNKNGKISR
ncbi:MAG: hypothetical protein ACJ75J_11840 [Cytophagaceae bacterium]